MALPAGVTIGRVTEGVQFNQFGQAYRVKIITYMVGQDGPFTLTVQPENDNQPYIEAQIGMQANNIAALRGGST